MFAFHADVNIDRIVRANVNAYKTCQKRHVIENKRVRVCKVYAGAFQNGLMTRKNFSTYSFLAHLFHNFHCYRLAFCSIRTIASVRISQETIPTIQIKTSVIGVNGRVSGARSGDFFCFMLMQHFFYFCPF